ncbi:MAG TPA: hypothetical protein PKZ53_10595, partial [Acidobacteriota bacterium]|nr:hypothetical protein [Acidobacteriota bacterium]
MATLTFLYRKSGTSRVLSGIGYLVLGDWCFKINPLKKSEEQRTKNQEPRTKNQERRTKNE